MERGVKAGGGFCPKERLMDAFSVADFLSRKDAKTQRREGRKKETATDLFSS
jgi:hypothetical protein